jgi:hypothetical protein
MSIRDPYLTNTGDLDVHLRDARHAHQLYTQHTFAMSPKTKFMYHVVFELHSEVRRGGFFSGNSSNTDRFKKEIGVLIKSADLPSYRVSVENKQQYNRKKNIQTRIDYQDVNLAFHDDNLGLTRGLLEDYYHYYYVDGNHRDKQGRFSSLFGSAQAFKPRDKYASNVPNYGLNNYKYDPFFKYVRIYQLARREWFAYTLVNPLITQFGHGDVDAASGDFNANTISLSYESVIYSNGKVNQRGEPVGFTDAETGYDNVMSPLGYMDNTLARGIDSLSKQPRLFDNLMNRGRGSILARTTNNDSRSNSILRNNGGALGMIGAGLQDLFSVTQPGGLLGAKVPNIDRRQASDISVLAAGNSRILDSDTILREFNAKPVAQASFIARALNSNAIPDETISTYNASAVSSRVAIDNELITRAVNGEIKLQKIATDAIEATKGTIV